MIRDLRRCVVHAVYPWRTCRGASPFFSVISSNSEICDEDLSILYKNILGFDISMAALLLLQVQDRGTQAAKSLTDADKVRIAIFLSSEEHEKITLCNRFHQNANPLRIGVRSGDLLATYCYLGTRYYTQCNERDAGVCTASSFRPRS